MASKTFACPACGEDVPIKAKACPHCGACEKSGWGDDSADGLDLENDFDYEKFTAEEFGTPRKVGGKQLLWKITAIVLLLVVLLGFLFSAGLFR